MKKFNLISASNDAGFTLLEILIAITLLAFITLGVVNITENAALTMERTTQVNKNNLQIETALSRFEWDFSQIYSPLYFSTRMNPRGPGNQLRGQGPNGTGIDTTQPEAISPEVQNFFEQMRARFERNEHFSGVSKEGMPIPKFHAPEKDVFEFFTSSNRRKFENTKQSHFAWVRYSLATPAPDTEKVENSNLPKSLKNLVRYFDADDPYNERKINVDDTENIKGAVLLENVEKLEFQFWDNVRRRWETSLTNVGGQELLRGVKILITWYDYSGNQRSIERIFRTNWPMIPPKDPIPTAPAAGGSTTVTPPPEENN